MRFVLRRLGSMVVVLVVVSFLTFLLMNLLPGGPEVNYLGPLYVEDLSLCEGTPTGDLARGCAETIDLRDKLNLDKPFFERYVSWVGNALTGDFGTSYRQEGVAVFDIINEALPTSLWLMVYAQVIAFVIAIPVAIYSAYRVGRWFDRGATAASFGVIAIPPFILALLLIYFFAVKLGWFPTVYDPDAEAVERLRSMFMPAFTLGLGLAAVYARLLRTDLVATLQEDFILMARAKGMPTWHILLRHALRPSTFSLITVAGIQIGALIGGALVVERIFSMPGLGTIIVESVLSRDYQVVQGAILLITAAYVAVNIAVDLVYGYLDPRVRHARAAT
ncbi:MAG TPA: ABC transporter permease [Acidimicrobiia bacterium]|nr:ABC transporter permease [Acidimicrobiia bacterium]